MDVNLFDIFARSAAGTNKEVKVSFHEHETDSRGKISKKGNNFYIVDDNKAMQQLRAEEIRSIQKLS